MTVMNARRRRQNQAKSKGAHQYWSPSYALVEPDVRLPNRYSTGGNGELKWGWVPWGLGTRDYGMGQDDEEDQGGKKEGRALCDAI